MRRRPGFAQLVFWVGVVFLYTPIVTLVIYSFNSSKIVMIWGGFSTRWYSALFDNALMITAARRTLEIALISATAGLVIGTMAAYALARFGAFRGRALFGGLITAPLVMPDVIIGMSLLLLFISLEQLIGWPDGRGMTTIAIAHITFCTSYVTVVMQSRMVAIDRSIEEAAMDLGCRPLQVIFDITLPIIAPALLSSWLLAFTLSLDDLVISAFVSGPGSTTLPLLIYSQVKLDVKPDVNALATIIVALVATGAIISGFVMSAREKRRQRDEQLAFSAQEPTPGA